MINTKMSRMEIPRRTRKKSKILKISFGDRSGA
jgi:hypothetical protein